MHIQNPQFRIFALTTQSSSSNDERYWTHFALIQQWEDEGGTKEGSLFIDGHKEASRSMEAPISPIEKTCIVLGRGLYHGRANAWDGQIENVKVYQRALSKSEIMEDAGISNKPKIEGDFMNSQGEHRFKVEPK